MTHEEAKKQGKPLHRAIMGQYHPVNEVRITKLKGELVRWEKEKQRALKNLKLERTEQQQQQQASSSDDSTS
jgi:hypothetical protein